MKYVFLCVIFLLIPVSALFAQAQDPYVWLEDIDGSKALDFVKKQNVRTLETLERRADYQRIFSKCQEISSSNELIAYPNTQGKYCYNFWKDTVHVRGIWRRATKESYMSKNPMWETMLDLDEMSKKDNIQWVFKGAVGLYPDYDRFLLSLSKGGGDAVVVKEFDAVKAAFIEDGFKLDEAKSRATYLNENEVLVETNFGEGSLTSSGYARQVKLWKRGTALKDAKLIFEGLVSDVSVSGWQLRDETQKFTMIGQYVSAFSSKLFVWQNNKLVKLDLPEDVELNALVNNQLVITLNSNWMVNGITYADGDVVSLNMLSLIQGTKDAHLVYHPDERSSVTTATSTNSILLLETMTNVRSELLVGKFTNNTWSLAKMAAPDYGTIYIVDVSEDNDEFYFSFTNFLEPTSLYHANANTTSITRCKSTPAFFDATKYTVEQYEARSKDGTQVPYFLVCTKNLQLNGLNPTLVYAYGGFNVASQPYYSASMGCAWLDNGGVYVLANIRGGSEFGPKWHDAAMKEKRQNAFNDFYAVAEDLISRKITTPRHLGIMGGSNGGLLVGVAFTQRPDLYNAAVCQVPLLDMQRYNKLLAGASWMAEYGDPDKPQDWAYLQQYSPYHNLRKDLHYPEVFFTTSTRDDRVHPGHARKMAAKMLDMGFPVYYFENTEGGHAGSSTVEQRAREQALEYSYLLMKLKD